MPVCPEVTSKHLLYTDMQDCRNEDTMMVVTVERRVVRDTADISTLKASFK